MPALKAFGHRFTGVAQIPFPHINIFDPGIAQLRATQTVGVSGRFDAVSVGSQKDRLNRQEGDRSAVADSAGLMGGG